jgi:hypothetical protein
LISSISSKTDGDKSISLLCSYKYFLYFVLTFKLNADEQRFSAGSEKPNWIKS